MTDMLDPQDLIRRAMAASIPAHLRAKASALRPKRGPTRLQRAAAQRRADLAPRVAAMRAQGATMTQVAEELGIALATVHKIITENQSREARE